MPSTLLPSPPQSTRTRPPHPAAEAVLWLWRLGLAGHAALVLGQPVLAGAYLSGDYDSIGLHGILGGLVVVATMVTGALALTHALLARGPWWPVLASVLLFLLSGIQVGLGYERNLLVHVPLGVLVVAGTFGLAVWAWTPAARGRR